MLSQASVTGLQSCAALRTHVPSCATTPHTSQHCTRCTAHAVLDVIKQHAARLWRTTHIALAVVHADSGHARDEDIVKAALAIFSRKWPKPKCA